MTENVLQWIEEHAREKGFTDEEHSLALLAEVRRLREAVEEYGSHGGGCALEWENRCSCGLWEAKGVAQEAPSS